MTEDERRTAALHSFYEAYRELQKGERILKVTQEDEADAYERAADQVKGLLERAKNETERRRRA